MQGCTLGYGPQNGLLISREGGHNGGPGLCGIMPKLSPFSGPISAPRSEPSKLETQYRTVKKGTRGGNGGSCHGVETQMIVVGANGQGGNRSPAQIPFLVPPDPCLQFLMVHECFLI